MFIEVKLVIFQIKNRNMACKHIRVKKLYVLIKIKGNECDLDKLNAIYCEKSRII